GDLVRGLHPDRLDAQRPGQVGELDGRVGQVEADREPVLGDVPLLPVLVDVQLQQLVAAVVADHELGGHAVPGCGPQGLVRVHAAAVAREAPDRLVRVGDLEPDGAGDADSQGPAAGQVVLARGGGDEVPGE